MEFHVAKHTNIFLFSSRYHRGSDFQIYRVPIASMLVVANIPRIILILILLIPILSKNLHVYNSRKQEMQFDVSKYTNIHTYTVDERIKDLLDKNLTVLCH